jgi:surface antigen
LSRAAQAFGGRFPYARKRLGLNAALLAAAMLPLCACASGGFSLEKAEVDKTILTGDISERGAPIADPERLSDEVTIRNAVSSADIEELAGAPLPWANAGTGSRGAITALAEHKEDGALCRRFTTSRESFDGVGLYRGEICMAAPGAWRMETFKAL